MGLKRANNMRVELPWPPSILSPNSRAHWTRKLKPKTKYKLDCYMLANAVFSGYCSPDGPIKVRLTFHPPDRRKRDDDNCEGAFKYGRDSVAAAMKVDDSRFRCERVMADPIKGGKVIFEVVEAGDG